MVLSYSLLHFRQYRCCECNPTLLPVTASDKWFICNDQPGWHFLRLFTDWILFQPQNICNHMSACRKCPLCQALSLHDPELEWSQALGGSTSTAAQRWGEFLEQCSLQTLAFQLAPAFIAPAEDNTAGCYNSCPLLQIDILGLHSGVPWAPLSEHLFTRVYAFPQSTQRSQLLGPCCWRKENACKIFYH